ncbi:MAG: STAS domain-containing protein [Sedimentisphaerales bacterium]|nr:STAS domain-containing protein [Sedimentisphaerales bacterium]
MTETPNKLVISREGQITIVELLDEEILEEATINEIADELFPLVSSKPNIQLLLSFIRVKHLSSSALGTLIRLNKRIEENKGTLKLCHLKKPLYEIFVITKLNRLFEIYDDQATALSSFEKKA